MPTNLPHLFLCASVIEKPPSIVAYLGVRTCRLRMVLLAFLSGFHCPWCVRTNTWFWDFWVLILNLWLEYDLRLHAIVLKLITISEILRRSIVIEKEHLLFLRPWITSNHWRKVDEVLILQIQVLSILIRFLLLLSTLLQWWTHALVLALKLILIHCCHAAVHLGLPALVESWCLWASVLGQEKPWV